MYPSESGYVSQIRDQCKEVEGILSKLFNQIEGVLPEVLIQALEPTKTKAEYYCPKKTGALVNSSFLRIAGTGSKPRVELGFAQGGNPSYAMYVHEMVEYHHEPPTRSKFLTVAVLEDTNNIQARITQQLAFGDVSAGSGYQG